MCFGTTPASSTRPEDYINHSLYFEAKTFLHGLLVVEDKLSMSHGLESRVPFLDNDLVDFAMRCPVRLKLKKSTQAARLNENESAKYVNRTADGKAILRRSCNAMCPPKLPWQRSRGFPRPTPAGLPGIRSTSCAGGCSPGTRASIDVMDPAILQGLVQEHLDGKTNRRLLIWSLLSVEAWSEHMQL